MKNKMTTVILRTYIKTLPSRNTVPTAAQQKIRNSNIKKKKGKMKICEIETLISRTDSKGLKEKCMLDIGIIQALKRPAL